MELNKYDLLSRGIYADHITPLDSLTNLVNSLWPVKVKFPLIRVGCNYDGGYLIPDDLEGIGACFSPGVATQASFEQDLLVSYKIGAHLADYSVDSPPPGLSPKSFLKKYLGALDDDIFITLDKWVADNTSLDQPEDLLLQMDIEGGEYSTILGASEETLKKFRIIVIEIHDAEAWAQINFFKLVETFFKKLLKNFNVVHNHPNNHSGIANIAGFLVPRVFELTLLRKDRALPEGFIRKFPHILDKPNSNEVEDFTLPENWFFKADNQFPLLTSDAEKFGYIYKEKLWGTSDDLDAPFFSGLGSNNPLVVNTYVGAVANFLNTFKAKPSVVDLGCGDFNIGSRIRGLCNEYIACDIVEPLVDFNKKKFSDLNVDFRLLDIVLEPLPTADIVIVRQVFQHLSNSQIQTVLSKISMNFSYLIITEEDVNDIRLQKNVDMKSSYKTRIFLNSGVSITHPPFNFQSISSQTLCEVMDHQFTNLTTILFKLK